MFRSPVSIMFLSYVPGIYDMDIRCLGYKIENESQNNKLMD